MIENQVCANFAHTESTRKKSLQIQQGWGQNITILNADDTQMSPTEFGSIEVHDVPHLRILNQLARNSYKFDAENKA